MRFFEKISFEQFKKDISNNEELYKNYSLPKRSTINSAGYDLKSIENVTIKPHHSEVIRTGLKVSMNDYEVFLIFIRSSLGYKYNISLANGVGVIDSDYYNNETNEGHFSVKLKNDGEEDFVVSVGDRIAQGIFIKYLTINSEEKIINKRVGGIGSTNKGEIK